MHHQRKDAVWPLKQSVELHPFPLDVSDKSESSQMSYTGFIRQPKWGHLRDLHKAIKLCEEYLISSDPVHQQLGNNLEVR